MTYVRYTTEEVLSYVTFFDEENDAFSFVNRLPAGTGYMIGSIENGDVFSLNRKDNFTRV